MNSMKPSYPKIKEFVIFDKRKQNIANNDVVEKQSKIKNLENKIEKLTKIRSKSKKENGEKKKINNLADMTENRLFMMSTVWPFDLFRNKVYIEEKQIILVFKQFFFVNQEYQILIDDILVPVVENSLLFSNLKIQLGPGGFQQDPPPVKFLPKNDAQKAKEIIMGLLVCSKEKININDIDKNELTDKLIEIGRYKKE